MLKLIICFLFMIPMANAFVWDECRRSFSNTKGKALSTRTLYRAIDYYSSSTPQFISSTGPCSALNKKDHAKIFYEENSEQLKTDFAKGEGDYLKTFLNYFKCSTSKEAREALKNNYEQIASFGLDQSFELSSKLIRNSCKY